MSIKLPKYPRICKSFKYSKIINYCITFKIVITNLSSILEIIKISIGPRITKFSQNVKLPNCPRQSTVTEIQVTVTRKLGLDTYGWAEFNGIGGELPRAVTAPESSLTPVSTTTIGRWWISGFQWLGWKPAKLRRTEAVILQFFAALIGSFLVVLRCKWRRKNNQRLKGFRSAPPLADRVVRNRNNGRVKFAGLGRVSRSFWQLPLSLSRVNSVQNIY